MTSQRKPGATADATAPTIMITATLRYTHLRPSTSAMRPKMSAPKNAPRIAAPVTQLVWSVLRCHWVATMVDTVPMTNRS